MWRILIFHDTLILVLTQAVVTRRGYGCITPPVWGGMTLASWSWASFTLPSWQSLPNNTPSTSVDTAPPSVPRLCVHQKKTIICIINGCCMNNSTNSPPSFGLKSTKILAFQGDFSVSLPISRLCLLEESLYLHPSCTPTWRAVGWGQFWWGEAKSWRWSRRTSTSVHTIRWATEGLPRGTQGRDPPFVQKVSFVKIILKKKNCLNFFFCTF